ncbi:MAG: sporulation protein YtfJ [Methanotrichaceae archaeon]|nr:sporulation protein YtfJ [Methanotrichaceae archaeon]
MDTVAEIIKTITAEMQKSLSAKTVVGDPVTIEGKTIVPLVSLGMGFGAGAGSGKDAPGGGGGGGGMGIKPVAVIVIDDRGARVETLKQPKPTLVEQLAEVVPRIAESMPTKKERQVEVEETG